MTTATPVKQTEEPARGEPTRGAAYYRPNVDIVECPHELLVLADMPGVARDAIDIHFEDGVLAIHGRVPPRQPETTRYLNQEYGVGDFYRTFRVGEAIDAARITAKYADGVLTLHLPKIDEVRPRKIQVLAE